MMQSKVGVEGCVTWGALGSFEVIDDAEQLLNEPGDKGWDFVWLVGVSSLEGASLTNMPTFLNRLKPKDEEEGS